MKEAIDAVENTSDYMRGEIARKKAIHNKDMADLIRDEHSAYYQKALDSSLAYDDLALGGERDLEKVRDSSALLLLHLIAVAIARDFYASRNKYFPVADTTAVLSTCCNSIAGETGQGRSQRGRTTTPRSGQLPNDRNGLPRHPRQSSSAPNLSVSHVGRHHSRQRRPHEQEGSHHVKVSMGLEAGYAPL